jgi:hypothetical protein
MSAVLRRLRVKSRARAMSAFLKRGLGGERILPVGFIAQLQPFDILLLV